MRGSGFQVETVDSLDCCLPALLPEAAGHVLAYVAPLMAAAHALAKTLQKELPPILP